MTGTDHSSATVYKAISKIAGTTFGSEILKSEHVLTGILCKGLSSKLPYSIIYHVSSMTIYADLLDLLAITICTGRSKTESSLIWAGINKGNCLN